MCRFFFFFFFFQAEDGIRDLYVTGVQTCALPILPAGADDSRLIVTMAATTRSLHQRRLEHLSSLQPRNLRLVYRNALERSEERRVGKECRSRWEPDH